jgi:glycine/D-amino acid oxidase-like deaminating enzyme
MIFDSIVIGKGLIGSAAARYLSQSEQNVAIIGPDEPIDMDKAVVFSSHYDEARIQRIIGKDPVWTLLNHQSAKQYLLLQKESNIKFHTGAGCLYVNPTGRDTYLEQIRLQADQFDLRYRQFENGEAIHKSFPDFNFPGSAKAVFESSPSGYINPRLLIKAQLTLFKKNGGIITNNIANELSHEENYIQITTLNGDIYKAKKVLLSPGAFINFLNLVRNKLVVTLKSETTIWANVTAEEAQRLSELPSLLYEIDIPEYRNIYLIQPVQYPDGKYYLKMGCNLPTDIYFDNLKDVQDWFRSGDSDANLKNLKDALMKIMHKLKVEAFVTKRCIVSFTKHRKPYIGALNNNGLFVAACGNGYSAMCSDALGRIASHLLTESVFPEEYSAESFQPMFADYHNRKYEK